MLFFISLFIFICLLIATILLLPREKQKKEIVLLDRKKESEKPWAFVEKGPDSSFIEKYE